MDLESPKAVGTKAPRLLGNEFISLPEIPQSVWQSDQPTFEIEKVQLQFDLQNGLQKLLVASNIMYILSANFVYRIDLNNPSAPSQIPLPVRKDGLTVSNCWLHPNGKFMILQLSNLQYFHLHFRYEKFKFLPRFKGYDAEFMSFPEKLGDLSTGDFLFTTKERIVYAANIKFHEPGLHDKKRDDKFVKLVYKSRDSIGGIAFSADDIQIQLVVGGEVIAWDCFEPTFAEYARVFRQPPKILAVLSKKESALFLASMLKFYLVISSTGDIYSNDEELQLSHTETLSTNKDVWVGPDSYISTVHHLIFLSSARDKIIIFNKLAPQNPIIRALDREIPIEERVVGIVSDSIGNTHWIYTCNGIYEIVISNEAISVWYNYYKMGNYEQALRLLDSEGDHTMSLKKNVVLIKQGYDLLHRGDFGHEPKNYEEALSLQLEGIRQLAKLQEPFEKVCLMLLSLQLSNVETSLMASKLLIEYLRVKFSISKSATNSKISRVILSTWIAQLHLRLLQVVKSELQIDAEIKTLGTPSKYSDAAARRERRNKDLTELNTSLKEFLRANYRDLDSTSIYEILTKMDFPDLLISFANLLEEYEYILHFYIETEMWNEALKALVRLYAKDKVKGVEAIQRTSTILLMNLPQRTIETWLQFPELDYESLFPAILAFNKNKVGLAFSHNPTMLFLLKLLFDKGVRSLAINNYYLALLIAHPHYDDIDQVTEALNKVLNHLRKSVSMGFPRKVSQYDSDFILRLCLKNQRFEAALLILTQDLHLFDAALNLALQHKLTSSAESILRLFDQFITDRFDETSSNELSTKNAVDNAQFSNRIEYEDEHFALRKKLWLTYAKYLIGGVCSGAQFDVLHDQLNDYTRRPHKRNLELTLVKSVTSELVEQMNNVVELKASSENLNVVLNYLFHVSNEGNHLPPVLSLKDLLPLLPENVPITSFKSEIVSSLDSYNNRINQLALEMQESAEIANKLKIQIQQSESHEKDGSLYTIIESGESCKLCGRLLISKNFIAFRNCHHAFHKDCTIRYNLQLKGDYRFKKIFQNFKNHSLATDGKEIDRLLVSECLLCNGSILNHVDESLYDSEKEKVDFEDWEL